MLGKWRKSDNVVQTYQIHDMTRALWGCVWSPSGVNGRWEAKIAPSPRASKQRFLGAYATEEEAKRAVERAVDRRAGNRGAALVELVIILPLLAVLLIGIIDFGLMQREHQVLQNAVREGARVSMLPNYHAGTALPVNGESKADASKRVAESVRDVVLAYLANENVTITKAECVDNNGDMSSFTCGEIGIDQGYAMTLSDGTLIGGSRVTVSTTRPALLGFYGPFRLSGVSVFRNLY